MSNPHTQAESLGKYKPKPLTLIPFFKDYRYHELIRLSKISGLQEKYINKSIMICPYCSFQLPEPDSFIIKRCPDCHHSLTKIKITIELLQLIKEQHPLQVGKD